MLRVTQWVGEAAKPDATLTLPFALRQRSRQRARLDNGQEVALLLPRGRMLRHGDLLQAENGSVIRVLAAPEDVSTAHTDDPLLLARACYHLGNRHVPLQIRDRWIRYGRDHVLDELVKKLGLKIVRERAPFDPEPGPYAPDHAHVAVAAEGHSHEASNRSDPSGRR
ncbi:MAG: urease accessory protein UreE [Deltaproteobacteria bacterium]|nr:urease accessory protein UreE [Deltaproteobacteria bacterium]